MRRGHFSIAIKYQDGDGPGSVVIGDIKMLTSTVLVEHGNDPEEVLTLLARRMARAILREVNRLSE